MLSRGTEQSIREGRISVVANRDKWVAAEYYESL